tara:strand:- start:106 stop:447 length:342 start_codon:yes stop_codon:yes gene_type:complete
VSLEETLLGPLLDLGGIGILAGFLMWIHIQNTKRLDAMQDKHDKLLADWRDERIDTIESLIDKITALDPKFDSMYEKLDGVLDRISTGLREMREHYQEARIEKLTEEAKKSKD